MEYHVYEGQNLLIVTDYTLIPSPFMDTSRTRRPLLDSRGMHAATLIQQCVTTPEQKSIIFIMVFYYFLVKSQRHKLLLC